MTSRRAKRARRQSRRSRRSGNAASRLDRFTIGYLEAALAYSRGSDGRPLDNTYSPSFIAKNTLATMLGDAERFQHENAVPLQATYDAGHKATTAGRDFWLARNRIASGPTTAVGPGLDLRRAAQAFGRYALDVGEDGQIHGVGWHESADLRRRR